MMDKKKMFLVIIFAVILAFVVAFLFKPAEKLKDIEQVESVQVEENIESDVLEDKFDKKELNDKDEETKPVASNIVSESSKKLVKEQSTNIEKTLVKNDEETVNVQEAGVMFEDAGVMSENGAVVVTREFKLKSPTKYTFEGFGILSKPPVR